MLELLRDSILLILVISCLPITSNLEGARVVFPVSDSWPLLLGFSTAKCSYQNMDFIYKLGKILSKLSPVILMWCSYISHRLRMSGEKACHKKRIFFFLSCVILDAVCVRINKFFISQQQNGNIGWFCTDCQQSPENKHRDQISVATKWFNDINFEEYVRNLIPDCFSPSPHVFAVR